MRRFIFLAVYILPNIYVFLRLRKWFVGERNRRLFSAVYLFLALGFPIAEWLSHGAGLSWARFLVLAGYYILAYLLYLFLTVVLADIVLALRRWLKIFSGQTSSRFRLLGILLLFVVPLVVVVGGSLNYSRIQISRYRIQIAQQSSLLNHLRIVVVADFHLRAMIERQWLNGVVDRINSLQPDLVLIPGDMLEGDRDDELRAGFDEPFRRIRSIYGLYACPGNHESHGGGNSWDFFKKAGIEVLADDLIAIDRSFYLAGRNDSRRGSRKSIDELLQPAVENLPVILLDHRPADLGPVSRSRVDIQVSGHTHFGQLFPLNLISQLQYELAWGYKQKNHTHFFVTSGIRGWGPPVRTAGSSEIMVIDVDLVAGLPE